MVTVATSVNCAAIGSGLASVVIAMIYVPASRSLNWLVLSRPNAIAVMSTALANLSTIYGFGSEGPPIQLLVLPYLPSLTFCPK